MSGRKLNDVRDWKSRFHKAIKNKAWNSAPMPAARPWNNEFFACFTPPDLCCITCCFPCVTFGKTHYREKNNGNMAGYEPINSTCIIFYLTSCFGVHWVMQAMQMQDIREKHNLEGSCTGDLLKSCCCLCCSILQAEKESKDRNIEQFGNQQYRGEQMVMSEP